MLNLSLVDSMKAQMRLGRKYMTLRELERNVGMNRGRIHRIFTGNIKETTLDEIQKFIDSGIICAASHKYSNLEFDELKDLQVKTQLQNKKLMAGLGYYRWAGNKADTILNSIKD